MSDSLGRGRHRAIVVVASWLAATEKNETDNALATKE